MFRADVRGEDGSADNPPAQIAPSEEVIGRSIFTLFDDPPCYAQQDSKIEGNSQPIEARESPGCEGELSCFGCQVLRGFSCLFTRDCSKNLEPKRAVRRTAASTLG